MRSLLLTRLLGPVLLSQRQRTSSWERRLVVVLGGANSTTQTQHRMVRLSYHKKLFPSLFYSLDVSSFQCDTCELAKSHRVPFPLSSNKSLIPFSLVHYDV
ncbi:hypothetical protein L3X38_044137 [Prunus dulcis]|uniref:GAG-pre-integrase domain-containing protein n=1 Tax=Prunus dulcis TaxID=3755 RepID=A0AAD4YMU4_PRUDU|nr:hypothetical protein L3X38_044137 [Prunus dulcis]